MFEEPTYADAILDRLVHTAYRLVLDGPSMRKLKAFEPEIAATPNDTTESAAAAPAATPSA